MIDVGACCTAIQEVTEEDLATTLYPGLCKSPVLATARLLRWCEHAVMERLGAAAVGVEVALHHLEPAVLGSRIMVKTCCVQVKDRASHWAFTAQDDHLRLIATGELCFVMVDQARYRARLQSTSS